LKDANGEGDSLVRERIMKATRKGGKGYLNLSASRKNAFIATLEVHNVVIDMAAESWRWYINYLEEIHQNKTRQVLTNDYKPPFLPDKVKHQPTSPQPAEAAVGKFLSRTGTWVKQKVRSSTLPVGNNMTTACTAIPIVQPVKTPRVSVSQRGPVNTDGKGDLTLDDVQECQNWEEKAGEALLVLDSNIDILTNISDYYRDLFSHKYFPQDLKDSCADNMTKFHKNISSVISDLRMQKARASTLQSVLRDRKNLVSHETQAL